MMVVAAIYLPIDHDEFGPDVGRQPAKLRCVHRIADIQRRADDEPTLALDMADVPAVAATVRHGRHLLRRQLTDGFSRDRRLHQPTYAQACAAKATINECRQTKKAKAKTQGKQTSQQMKHSRGGVDLLRRIRLVAHMYSPYCFFLGSC